MPLTLLADAARLSDRELLARVKLLACRERVVTVELVAHLAELDKRKLYRGEGYSSLFKYCTGALKLSEQATYKRIDVARACRRFPMLLERLADGSMNLSTIRMLAPHFTRENLHAVVAEATGRSKREVEALVARLAPKPDVPTTIRKLPTPVAAPLQPAAAAPAVPAPAAMPLVIGSGPAERPVPPPPATTTEAPALTSPAPAPRATVAALSPDRYRLQMTISGQTRETLEQLQCLLRREIPDGDPVTIVDRALQLYLEEVARRKLRAVKNPRSSGKPHDVHSRYLPSAVVRAVWARDGGACAFVAKNGQRCGSRALLEFHHRDPHALGGETTEENLSLLCRTHNTYEAELVYGPYQPKVSEPRATYDAGRPPHGTGHHKILGSTSRGAS